ncbi:MAG: thiamine-phosphate kinase [Candidatus Bathyarchaeota archaeon]|nr:thiamine-phosphate kinase [Candidatus Bathyarchaeota archaeon]
MRNTNKTSTAEELGERKIIQTIKNHLTSMPGEPVPFGDDVSAVDFGCELAVLKTDMLVRATDIPVGMNAYQTGRKAVVMNVSDFAAKGAKPVAVLVALGLPAKTSQEEIVQIAMGLNDGAQEYGAYVVGGDTCQTDDLTISISLFGSAEKNKLMLRSGAKAEDILAVTGFFGNTTAGLKLLSEKCVVTERLHKPLLDSVFMPVARLKEGFALSESNAISACMDSSDGLAISLHQLSEMSNVGFRIEHLPVSVDASEFAQLNGLDVADLALYGGEEYELVLTVKPEMWMQAESAVKSVGGRLLPIGKATADKQILLDEGEKKKVIVYGGWEHFKSEP